MDIWYGSSTDLPIITRGMVEANHTFITLIPKIVAGAEEIEHFCKIIRYMKNFANRLEKVAP